MKQWLYLLIVFTFLHSNNSSADQSAACFVGKDQHGDTARMELRAERVNNYFEISGRVMSPNIGIMRLKAGGWSGAGRMFYKHEYDNSAIFIKITNYSDSGFTLEVNGMGYFPFYTTAC